MMASSKLDLSEFDRSEEQTAENDMLDDDFTPEELSLVQRLLPPERFLRVLSVLRQTSENRSSASKGLLTLDPVTPRKQLHPLFRSEGSPHTPRRQSQAAISRQGRQLSSSSNDGGVQTPPRQFATAAAESQHRLGQAAKLNQGAQSSDDEDDEVGSAASTLGDDQTLQSSANKHADAEVADEDQHGEGYKSHATDQVQKKQRRNVQPRPGPSPRSGVQSDRHTPVQKSGGTRRADTDDGEDEQLPSRSGISDGQDDQLCASPDQHHPQQKSKAALQVGQLQSMDSAHKFLDRLNQPARQQSSLQSQSSQSMQHFPSPAQLQPWSQSKLQSQLSKVQPQASLSQQRQHPLGSSALRRNQSGSGAAHSSVTAARQPSVQPLSGRSTASGRSSASGDGVYMDQSEAAASPVQSAVAAVAGRLQSVQQGLASAEGRLAQLTGRTPPYRQLLPEEERKSAGLALHHDSSAVMHEPSGVADIIRRFDSGSAWSRTQNSPRSQGTSAQSPRFQGRSQFSNLSTQGSPRISALRIGHEQFEDIQVNEEASRLADDQDSWDESTQAAAATINEDSVSDGDDSVLRPQQSVPSGGQSLRKGSLALPQLEGQGSLIVPQLKGQGSSMRGDLWLPQQWLEPGEETLDEGAGVVSPRDRMHAAMEAVRAAERAVEAAAVLSPIRHR